MGSPAGGGDDVSMRVVERSSIKQAGGLASPRVRP